MNNHSQFSDNFCQSFLLNSFAMLAFVYIN